MAARAGSGHWVAMDGPKEMGGADAATRPLELFLMGLAGCSGMDVISMLAKMRAPLRDLRMELSAPREDDYPQVFKKIEIVYHFYGDLSEKQAERAVSLSHEKFCSASAMLKPTVPIEHQIVIHREEEALAEGGTVKEST